MLRVSYYVSSLLFGLFSVVVAFSQTQDPLDNEAIRDLLENTVQDAENGDQTFETVQEKWEQIRQNPINLNHATASDLSELGFLLPFQVQAILNHKNTYGDFLSIYELQSIVSLNRTDLERLIPLVSVGNAGERTRTPWTRQLFGGTRQLFIRYSTILEDQKGFVAPDSARNYMGNRAKVYLRYRYQFSNRISYGITAEKDPGESWFNAAQPRGFDFYSAHFYLRDIGRMKDLCVGDYELSLGQGLVWWSGFGFRKSSAAMSVQKSGRVLGPYTSVSENQFLRGAAARLAWGSTQLTVFSSYKAIDANLQAASDTLADPDANPGTDPDATTISSFVEDGFHRTDLELAKKDAVREAVFGADLTYTVTWSKVYFKIGALASHVRYNVNLEAGDQPYNQFAFSGNQLSNASLHYSGGWKNLSVYGETALSDNGAVATVNGVLASLHPRLDLSVVHRRYDRAYQSIYAAPFAEQVAGQNEQGVYFGLSFRPMSRFTLEAYVDQYRHDWLRFRADAPSRGHDYLVQLQYSASRNTVMYWRARHEIKQENAPDNETPQDFLVNNRRSSIRYNLTTQLSPEIKLQSRVEWVWTNDGIGPTEQGLLIFQNIQWSPEKLPLVLTARYTLFDTESFASRVYSFENDVLYAFSIPFFSDRGSRYYLLCRYRATRWLDVYARFARTTYANRETNGNDLDEIDGPHKSEFKIMMRVKW